MPKGNEYVGLLILKLVQINKKIFLLPVSFCTMLVGYGYSSDEEQYHHDDSVIIGEVNVPAKRKTTESSFVPKIMREGHSGARESSFVPQNPAKRIKTNSLVSVLPKPQNTKKYLSFISCILTVQNRGRNSGERTIF